MATSYSHEQVLTLIAESLTDLTPQQASAMLQVLMDDHDVVFDPETGVSTVGPEDAT